MDCDWLNTCKSCIIELHKIDMGVVSPRLIQVLCLQTTSGSAEDMSGDEATVCKFASLHQVFEC